MFGIFRYLLAHIVIVTHFWPMWGDWGSAYAGFAFYLLSGYLMTRGLREIYGYSPRAVGYFLVNRATRLLPLYWIVLFLSAGVLLLAPEAGLALRTAYSVPTHWQDWLRNVFLIDLRSTHSVLVPAAAPLAILFIFYTAMALGLSRYRIAVWFWVTVSAAYTAYLFFIDVPFLERYISIGAAVLPFGVGALLAHYPLLHWRWPAWFGVVAVALFVAHSVLAQVLWDDPFRTGFYMSFVLAILVLLSLRHLDSKRFPLWLQHIEHECDALAYPVFLLQWLAALLVVSMGVAGPDFANGWLFVTTVTLTDMMAWVSYHHIEQPITSWRKRLRQRAAETRGQHDA